VLHLPKTQLFGPGPGQRVTNLQAPSIPPRLHSTVRLIRSRWTCLVVGVLANVVDVVSRPFRGTPATSSRHVAGTCPRTPDTSDFSVVSQLVFMGFVTSDDDRCSFDVSGMKQFCQQVPCAIFSVWGLIGDSVRSGLPIGSFPVVLVTKTDKKRTANNCRQHTRLLHIWFVSRVQTAPTIRIGRSCLRCPVLPDFPVSREGREGRESVPCSHVRARACVRGL
jgi:hypothetical protein